MAALFRGIMLRMRSNSNGKEVDMKVYTLKVYVPDDGEPTILRVTGETPQQAITGGYDYLVRQFDGNGEVDETSLTEVFE